MWITRKAVVFCAILFGDNRGLRFLVLTSVSAFFICGGIVLKNHRIKEFPRYDITQRYPNVLVIGNGLIKSSAISNQTNSWGESIYCLTDKEVTDEEKSRFEGIPYSVVASINASFDDTERQNRYIGVFQSQRLQPNSILERLARLQFDSILTTNYTYEIENVFNDHYSSLKDKSKYVQKKSETTDGKYLLHYFNRINSSPEIWHIHGELRRKSSIILTHDEYARLIHKIIERNKNIGNRYKLHEKDLNFSSWVDYFILGNLYIIGLGMDFSEFDLWWLLNRRKREKAKCGKIHFFASKKDSEKVCTAIEKFGASVHRYTELDNQFFSEGEYFNAFYNKAVDEIENLLNKEREK